ncbi:hypothetical protein [Mesorhizobium neociceri]|uniref:Uncharacterized protein n=1 Tax=Mesorhizobium neociceri TaxID=1307853 RepID=A0A838B8A5_9HYPH|nr:hypothetical protein [Mesorhizobium neociceri]MBA1142372.1 hypothetical protein [Mesorhizobium neociceri]
MRNSTVLARPSEITAQLGSASFWQGHTFRRMQSFQFLGCLAQIGFEGANAETSEDCLDAVDDPCTFADEIVSFTVRTAGLLLIDGCDGCHAAVALLAPQPAKKGAHQQFGIEAIGLGTPMFEGTATLDGCMT